MGRMSELIYDLERAQRIITTPIGYKRSINTLPEEEIYLIVFWNKVDDTFSNIEAFFNFKNAEKILSNYQRDCPDYHEYFLDTVRLMD